MRLLRALAKVFFGLTFIILLLALGGYYYLRSSTLPQTSGRLVLEGLSAPVEVLRDGNGVIHVKAHNEHDLFFAQAVAQAQERLWQMEFQRRIGAGRLAEILGKEALAKDEYLRTMGFYRAAQQAYKNLPEDMKAVVRAYSDGINAYLATNPPLPLEFKLLGFKPEPWTPADVLVWQKMMSYDLCGNLEAELTRYNLLARGLSKERIAQLMPGYPEGAPTIVKRTPAGLKKPAPPEPQAPTPAPAPGGSAWSGRLLTLVRSMPSGVEASNNWVVAGSRSSTGLPILANDPHLDFGAPSIWILMELESPSYHASGATFPGLPTVIIGKNQHIAWGVTNHPADVQDLYVMQEKDGGYLYKGQVRPYRLRHEKIAVKGGAPVDLTVRESVYGPVISDVVNAPAGAALSLRWTSLEPDDNTISAFYSIGKAENWQEFTAALKHLKAPSQNFVYADDKGNIGYIAPGLVPIRKAGHSGEYPVPGNGDWDWRGYVPYRAMPHAYNPPEGYIASANNLSTPRDWPYTFGHEWAAPYRIERIEQLIRSKPKLSPDDFAAMQADVVNLAVPEFQKVLALIKPKSKRAAAWRQKLLAWDGRESVDSQEASVYEAWYSELARLPEKEVGRAYWSRPLYLLRAMRQGDRACEQRGETCLQFAAEALERALARLDNQGGILPWGQLHPAAFNHAVMHHVPQLRRFFDRSIADGGDRYTINMGEYDMSTFTSVHGPSYRQIIALGHPELSRWVHPMGQSGNVLSRHYADLLPLWARVSYLPMKGRAAVSRLLLEP